MTYIYLYIFASAIFMIWLWRSARNLKRELAWQQQGAPIDARLLDEETSHKMIRNTPPPPFNAFTYYSLENTCKLQADAAKKKKKQKATTVPVNQEGAHT